VQPRPAIYLDANAGALVHPQVSAAVRELFQDQEAFSFNPSSIHAHGRKARRYLNEARDRVALSLGVSSDDLIFTSSGTEANQLAIRSVFDASFRDADLNQKVRPTFWHWISTPVEHECNLQMQDWLRERGGTVSFLPVDSNGAPIVSKLRELIRPETALVSAIWVNNETGVITDVEALSRECQTHGIPLHLDAAQAWGKLPIDLKQLNVTYAAVAAHKIGALAGTGALYVKPRATFTSQMKGKQERARRGGTENLLGIVAAGVAASQIDLNQWKEIEILRNRLQNKIESQIQGTLINGGGAPRIANTLSMCFEGIEKEGLVTALDLEGFSVSSGSACSSGVVEPSHVLLALGRSPGLSSAGLRVSISSGTTWAQLEEFAGVLEKVVARIRQSSTSIGNHRVTSAAISH
jgi:cysteine desulfurase